MKHGVIISDASGTFYYVRPIATEPDRVWYSVDVSCYRQQQSWLKEYPTWKEY